MKIKHYLLLTSAVCALTTSAQDGKKAKKSAKKPAIDKASMDLSVKPNQNFYQYANGTWLKNNPVPSTESRWGNFNIVAERNNDILRGILENLAKTTHTPGSIEDKIATFYKLYVDTNKRKYDGLKSAIPFLDKINTISGGKQMFDVIADMHRKGISTLFRFSISQDAKNSKVYIPYLSQGGLGLPDKDFYFKTDEKSKKIRVEYKKYISLVLENYGSDKDKQIRNAETIFKIESDLASGSMSRLERRDPEKQYNKFASDYLENEYPNLPLKNYITRTGVIPFSEILISQPNFFANLNTILNKYTIEDWKVYLSWTFMNNTISLLTPDLEKLQFSFYATVLSGTKEQKPLWKKAISACNGGVGEMLGQLFVKQTFSPNAKKQVNTMVSNISNAFEERLSKLQWMSDETKEKAKIKLSSISRKFGYTDKWTDYTTLNITNSSYFENVLAANEFDYNEMINRLGKPIDKTQWGMLPQTVNAYYNPINNEIVFPAAILQSPFFDENADAALNYGAIGAVIGHEITHGFDDQGSKYDANGNLNSWWTENDRKQFETRTNVLVEQFNKFKVGDSLYVNGKLTLGENIADLGGLSIAYDAFKLYLKQHPEENVVKDGFTPEQRFFIGFAQLWKNNARPEAIRQLILTDTHSPGEFRVKGPLSNMPTFYEAFKVKDGDEMYINDAGRADIW
ncbi:MAG: M13 family metallopeptidase [Bacteroidia bacterium]